MIEYLADLSGGPEANLLAAKKNYLDLKSNL